MSTFLEQYEPLDIIGNGSFGIIRKVRSKSDGSIFARKELNFERMSDRDRKQIVAEVNILKDLDHEHIVRYHDRYVDRDAGILYILMEYCGGGDLSGVIKQAQKYNRPVPEDTIWNYFMQILLALQHCHHPPNTIPDVDGRERRPQILHRDLKPDNVFLDENNSVKLGDFGLSKALPQASFANTYVGTPYYMSPELMQEKAYDSKSDIWSLGCLIYELCALKPPFHEAKTHAELSIFIRNGRIPPLPRGYSQTLSSVIKAMLNLNPAMRPSATQLLQHERLALITKVIEAEKMLSTVKTHKSAIIAKERDIYAREAALAEQEAKLTALMVEKDAEILRLHNVVSTAQSQLDAGIREAIGRREEELRVAVRKREEEVAAAMARREEEILSAVRQREQEIFDAWRAREEQIKMEAEAMSADKMRWIAAREADLEAEQTRLEEVQKDLEARLAALSSQEVKIPNARSNMATPINRNVARPMQNLVPSAMKGVVFTQTGQPLATPTPAELANLFVNSPKVGLDFAKIFEFESKLEDDDSDSEEAMPPSPTVRERPLSDGSSHSSGSGGSTSGSAPYAPPTRLRKPSIRDSVRRPLVRRTSTLPVSASDPTGLASSSRVRATKSAKSKSGGEETIAPSDKPSIPVRPAKYNLSDEENLPSPFLRRRERERPAPPSSVAFKAKRPSTGNLLRAVAAANSAAAAAGLKPGSNATKALGSKVSLSPSLGGTRPSLTNTRKVLSRS
ncbi:kinase-like domain-containing protein [Boletus reticuloceps]|uniref:non-specific serine/threonine protein kinase n=1 Tax=Boletus reticuloceps TaxID=495285 RepID=A0A8I3AAQ1_9AGAM|nr:kinase-like domain-containing protein [Boletus reticuloceps]